MLLKYEFYEFEKMNKIRDSTTLQDPVFEKRNNSLLIAVYDGGLK